jgi:hypothetical protein
LKYTPPPNIDLGIVHKVLKSIVRREPFTFEDLHYNFEDASNWSDTVKFIKNNKFVKLDFGIYVLSKYGEKAQDCKDMNSYFAWKRRKDVSDKIANLPKKYWYLTGAATFAAGILIPRIFPEAKQQKCSTAKPAPKHDKDTLLQKQPASYK